MFLVGDKSELELEVANKLVEEEFVLEADTV